MLKFTERPKTPGTTSKKKETKGNILFACNFRANLDEANVDMVQFTKRWNWKWIVWHQGYFCRKFAATKNVSSAPKDMHLPVFKACLSSSYMAGQNIKKNYLMCHIPIKMLKQHVIPNSSLHNLKICSSTGCRKTNQRWIRCMFLANTAILNTRIFSRRYHFRLWVFASTGEYFYYWHWRVLPNELQSKWWQDL